MAKILHLLMPRNCCLNSCNPSGGILICFIRLLGRINVPKSSETAEDLAIRKL